MKMYKHRTPTYKYGRDLFLPVYIPWIFKKKKKNKKKKKQFYLFFKRTNDVIGSSWSMSKR